jgi:two-component system, NarL family, response regulator NreC
MELKQPIRLLIADDHQLFRSGVSSLLDDDSDIVIIGEAENGLQLLEKYFALQPDIILVDISMPDMNGIDAFKEIRKKDKQAKALFLTMHDSEEYIYYTYKVGGMGLISKNTLKGELLFAIKTIFNGEKYFGKKYSISRIKEIEAKYKQSTLWENDEYVHLTMRERKILEYLSKGMLSQEMAEQLGLTKRVVDHTRAKLMQKLEIKSLPEFISYAVKYSMANKIFENEE